MKEIKAIIQPFMLEHVINALHQIRNLPAVTISPAYGLSVERGAFDQVAKTKLEIIVPDESVEHLVDTIQKAAPAPCKRPVSKTVSSSRVGQGHAKCRQSACVPLYMCYNYL